MTPAKCIRESCQSKASSVSLASWILIVLIPKCPLCLLSYSTAVSLCGGKTIFADSVGWTSYIPFALAMILIGSFIYNYKGRRTIIAILFAVLGSIIILYGEYYIKTLSMFYLGSSILLIACWVNGSLNYFLKKFTNYKTVLK